MGTLAFGHHEDSTPAHRYAETREAAMAAFAKSWLHKVGWPIERRTQVQRQFA